MIRGSGLLFVAVAPFWLGAYIFGGWRGVAIMALGGILAELLIAWGEIRRQRSEASAPPATSEPVATPDPESPNLRDQAEALLHHHRSRGENGLVVIDFDHETVTWLATTTRPFIGPEGRA